MDFPPEQQTPPHMIPLNNSLPSCGDAPLACSCGDCPAAPGCQAPQPPPPLPAPGCPAAGTQTLTCGDLGLAAVYAGLLACLPLFIRSASWQLEAAEYDAIGEAVVNGGGGTATKHRSSRAAMAAAAAAATAQEAGGSGSGEGGDDGELFMEYPATEQVLRRW